MSRFNSREEFEQWKAERTARLKQAASNAPAAPDPTIDADDAERTERAIRLAWQAGAGIAVLMLIAVIVSASGFQILDFTPWSLIDAALILVLSFGVYKKDRASSLLLLLYFVISRIYLWEETGRPYGFLVTLMLGYFFLQGIRGTFAHHASSETDSGSPPWKPVAAALSIAALFVLLLFGEETGMPVDLSLVYSSGSHPAAASDWRPTVSPGGRFSIDMPGEPVLGSKTIEVNGEMRPLFSYTLLLSKNSAYTVQYLDVPERTGPEANAIQSDLNEERDRIIADAGGKLGGEIAVNLGSWTGREVQFENDRAAFRARLFMVDRRIYQCIAMMPKNRIFSDDVNRFLVSFRPMVDDLTAADNAPVVDTWLDFSPAGGRFSIEMPRMPVARQEPVRTSAGEMTLYLFNLDREELGQKYSVQYADYPEALMQQLRSANTVLGNASTVDVENIRGKLVSEKIVSLGRYPGRELQIENADIAMRIKLFFVDRRLYKITVVRPRLPGFSADDDRFMASFHLTP